MSSCYVEHPTRSISIDSDCQCKQLYAAFKKEYSYQSDDLILNFIVNEARKKKDFFESDTSLFGIRSHSKATESKDKRQHFKLFWHGWIDGAYYEKSEYDSIAVGYKSKAFPYPSEALIWLAFHLERLNQLQENKYE